MPGSSFGVFFEIVATFTPKNQRKRQNIWRFFRKSSRYSRLAPMPITDPWERIVYFLANLPYKIKQMSSDQKQIKKIKQIKKNCDWRSGLTLWFNCGEVVVVFHYVVRFHFAMYSFSLVLPQQEAISSVQDKVSKQWPKPCLFAV